MKLKPGTQVRHGKCKKNICKTTIPTISSLTPNRKFWGWWPTRTILTELFRQKRPKQP